MQTQNNILINNTLKQQRTIHSNTISIHIITKQHIVTTITIYQRSETNTITPKHTNKTINESSKTNIHKNQRPVTHSISKNKQQHIEASKKHLFVAICWCVMVCVVM